MSDLIRREDAIQTARMMIGLTADERENEIRAIPTAEPLVTVKAKQNEGLYLDTDEETLLETEYIVVATNGWYKEFIHETDGKPKVGKWIRTGRANVYGGTELVCPFCDDHVMVAHIEDELYCRHCGALLGDRAKGETDE